MMILRHKLTVYVARPENIQPIARKLSAVFGGATALPTQGYWVMSDGSLAVDPTHLVYSFTPEAVSLDHPVVQEVIQFVFANSSEEAVAIEVDGTLFILDRAEVLAQEQSEVA